MSQPPRIPAWAASPGLLFLLFREALLPGYDMRALPGPDVRAVLTWGQKGTGWAGRAMAKARRLPIITLEDGFLRSVGLGEQGAASLSLIADDLGTHYDASRPSRLETLIATAPDWCNAAVHARARALLDRLVETGLSKTNRGGPLDRSVLEPRRRVLVVDQTRGDAAVSASPPDAVARMMAAVRAAEPTSQIIVKRHPAVAAGLKAGCILDADLYGLTVIDADVRPADLLAEVEAVFTVSSGLGFEALWRGLPVHCFGTPFYAGWGLTIDAAPVPSRGNSRTIEALAAAALIRLPAYVDPVTGDPCQVEQAVERLLSLHRRAEGLSGYWAGVGFSPAKRAPVRRLLNAPGARLDIFDDPKAAAEAARARDGRLVWWAGKETPAILDAAAGFDGPTVRMEDGFLRSRGLGSDFVGALSAALDDQGIYYDPTGPSRLETLIQTGAPTPADLDRAEALRARIVQAGLSKYNLAGAAPTDWPTDRERLLVVGQVENDRSILLGCETIRTNAALIAAARAARPDAFLIWRAHPDVTTGNRPGAVSPEDLKAVDAVADDLGIAACLDACDTVATMTSLAGFEALMRGKPVLTFGRPFYAGWGLSEDALTIPRRTARPSLAALIHAALIAYPLYVTPEGWPCEAEDLVERLTAEAVSAARIRPSGISRWLTGFTASLDRRPPPAY